MKACCKKSYYGFKKGEYYNIVQYCSVFEKNDFITIQSNEALEHSWYRFRLNQSLEYIDDYIGRNELYFYDYFTIITEERKLKLEQLSEIKS